MEPGVPTVLNRRPRETMKMKKFFVLTALLLAFAATASAQQFVQAQTFPIASVPGAQPAVYENSLASVHTISWVVTATVSTCTLQLETSAAGSSFALMSGSAAQTCTSSGTYTFSGVSANYVRFNVSALTGSGSGQIVVTYSASYAAYTPNFQDGYFVVPPSACGVSAATGTAGTGFNTLILDGS